MESDRTRVLEAGNGQAAIDLLLEMDGAVDLVLLDLTMPVMSGEDAYREIRTRYPNLPVIMSSGFSASEHVERFGLDSTLLFLQKPYQIKEMKAVFEQALGG